MQSILIQVKRNALALAEVTVVVAVIFGLAATALPGFLRAFKRMHSPGISRVRLLRAVRRSVA